VWDFFNAIVDDDEEDGLMAGADVKRTNTDTTAAPTRNTAAAPRAPPSLGLVGSCRDPPALLLLLLEELELEL
jgi:hypothetical protein